jgi:hypothetical protein
MMSNLGRQFITLILAFSPVISHAAVLNYQSPDLNYELDYKSGILRYRSANLSYTFQKKDCSKKLVEDFWNEKKNFVGALPQSSSFKRSARARFNNKTYVIPLRKKNILGKVPREIQALIVQEAAKCSG